MSKYNITMKQKNDSDYDELYPESLDTQIKLSKDTTGFTGTNVSQVLMELNNKIPGVLPEAGTYQLVGCVEDYRNNQAITGKTVIKTEIPWSKTPSNILKNGTPDLYICYIGDQPMNRYGANVEPQTACFIFGPDIDKRYYLKDTSPSTWAPAMAFGYQWSNAPFNTDSSSYGNVKVSEFKYRDLCTIKTFWRNDNFTPTVLSQLEGISCYQSTSTRSTSYGPEIVMETSGNAYNNSLCITNIDLTNGVTVHWGCQGNNPGYSLWSLTLLVFKRMNE